MNRHRVVSLVLLALACASSGPAYARDAEPTSEPYALPPELAFADPSDPDPGSGAAKIVAGFIGLGVAASNAVQLPFCAIDQPFVPGRTCVRIAASLAAVGLAVGVPLLVLGYRQRARRKAWLARRLRADGHAVRLSVAPAGGLLSYRRTF